MLKTKKNSYKLKLSILSIICLLGMIISGHLYRVAYTQFIEYKVHYLGLAGNRYVEYVHYSLKCSSYILLWLIFSLFELLNLIAISSYHLDKLNTKSSRYNEVFKENMKLESDLNKLFSFSVIFMRYHYIKPSIYSCMYGSVYFCDDEFYARNLHPI